MQLPSKTTWASLLCNGAHFVWPHVREIQDIFLGSWAVGLDSSFAGKRFEQIQINSLIKRFLMKWTRIPPTPFLFTLFPFFHPVAIIQFGCIGQSNFTSPADRCLSPINNKNPLLTCIYQVIYIFGAHMMITHRTFSWSCFSQDCTDTSSNEPDDNGASLPSPRLCFGYHTQFGAISSRAVWRTKW